MTIYFGADHRGFETKERLKKFVEELGYEVVDLGNDKYEESDDYPDFASLVAKKVSADPTCRGILLCGSGGGVNIVANKFPRVRSNIGLSPLQVYAARRDDDCNILCLAASFMIEDEEKKSVKTFLTTEFSGEERHRRRLGKIDVLEKTNFVSGL
jgi:ribose 5-phosphate isomerase B